MTFWANRIDSNKQTETGNKMDRIFLIGAGNLGSRHLQGLCLLPYKTHITLVDPSEQSLATAVSRAKEVDPKSRHEIDCLKDISDMASNYDFGIIATSSNVRFNVLKQLETKKVKVPYIVLEKVLFQNIDELAGAEAILQNLGSKAWVNCPRRLSPSYQNLKKKLQNKKWKSFNVTGNDWGLGSNTIHFLDLFQFLSGDTLKTMDTSGLEPEIFPASRPGFVEFYGVLSGLSRGGVQYIINCSHFPQDIVVRIETIDGVFEINESKKIIKSPQGEESFDMENQSGLTHKIWEELKNDQSSVLTTYSESKELHWRFLSQLSMFYSALDKTHKTKSLPIT